MTALADCRSGAVGSPAPSATCSVGFPWYPGPSRFSVLADLGVITQTSVSLAGPGGAGVRETVLRFERPGHPGMDAVRTVTAQCGEPGTRNGIRGSTVDDVTTATAVSGDLLIGVEFTGTDLSAADRAAIVRLAAERAPDLPA